MTTEESDHTTGNTTGNTTGRRRRRIVIWSAVGVLVAVAIAGALLWWFLRDDAPSAASIDKAAEQAQTAETNPGTGPNTAAGVDGTWNVDTSIREFDFEQSTGTFVGFRVKEELSAIGSTTAVGRTPEVSGSLQIDGTTVTDVTVEADMTAITTNDSRRNGRVQSALDTSQFPTASFHTTEPIELGEEALNGDKVSVSATGELTVHGVTKTVTIPLDAQLVGETIVVVGSLDIVFADYGVTPPKAPIVLSVSDDGQMEFQLFFTG